MADDWERLKDLMKGIDNEHGELRADYNRIAAEMEQSRATIAKEETTIAQKMIERASLKAKLAEVELRKQAVVGPRKRALSLDKDDLACDANIAGRASESNPQRARKRMARQDPVFKGVSAYEHREDDGAVVPFKRESGRSSQVDARQPTSTHVPQASDSMSLDKDNRTSDTSRAPESNPSSTSTIWSRRAATPPPLTPPEHTSPGKKKPAPKPGSDNKGAIMRIPQPQAGAYYALPVRDFNRQHVKRKRALVHVGRIEETGDGEDCRPGCGRCEAKGYACRRYTNSMMEKTRCFRCARCAYDGKSCK